jgi:hypothetical protein
MPTPRAVREHVRAEPRDVRNADREIDLEVLLERDALLFVHDRVREPRRVVATDRLDVQSPHLAVDAHRRHLAGSDVHVGSAVLHRERQELVDVDRHRAGPSIPQAPRTPGRPKIRRKE